MHGDTIPIADWVAIRSANMLAGPAARRDTPRRERSASRNHTGVSPPRPFGFWREIGGTWERGPAWTGSDGLAKSTRHRCRALAHPGGAWDCLGHRSSGRTRATFIQLWFGVYGGIVYHHGAAFRKPLSRLDASLAPPEATCVAACPVPGARASRAAKPATRRAGLSPRRRGRRVLARVRLAPPRGEPQAGDDRPCHGHTSMTAFLPRSFDAPLARSRMSTGTSSTSSPAAGGGSAPPPRARRWNTSRRGGEAPSCRPRTSRSSDR